jgi:8-oxo-dGTP diphosphatase
MPDLEFPTVFWGQTQVRFVAAATDLCAAPTCYAALVFPFVGERCVVAAIRGRGWCIPGGRLEAGETPEVAARREAHEEAGLTLGPLHLIGHYRLTEQETETERQVAVFIARDPVQGNLPPGTESKGTCLLTLDELPERYYLWDPLLEAVCAYAFALHRRRA